MHLENNRSSERAYWLAWSQIDGVGPITLRRLREFFGDLKTAWQASPADWLAVDGIGLQLADAIANAHAKMDAIALLEKHEQANPHFWTPADSDYPQLLHEIFDPPATLYYRGKVDLAENQGIQPMIGIVGTRAPSDYGHKWTEWLTEALIGQGFSIVSGLAEGIDTDAHRTCLQNRGRTIAVLGTGLDITYPYQNRQLYHRLVESGLALSEYPAGTKPDRPNFPRRNRIIAGLCRAVIVMEAPARSGALITAHMAAEYGRDVYVLPGSLDNPQSHGCLALLNQGAQVILGKNHLLELLGTLPQMELPFPKPVEPQPPQPPLTPQQQHILLALSKLAPTGEAVSFDRLVQQTELAASILSAELLQLELLEIVAQLPGMLYRKV
ncbi:MAG TPA: DNA-protecting protein DprA [Leptolyngbyaceae cyanobacterium M33_DOE_097]|uniref:DNA-protecting protein DprA n=1 Tax=Oscillatoriales cyanobacterium SpSt-418 TaxID=2282169 RepID=A0A7C3PHU7_9CYAN|nr:DNA-protecting protein DprA [Leptolyngbyaceae cyanobacterium M33_DOE_097]